MGLVLWLVLCVCAVAAATQSHNVTRRDSGSRPEKRVVCYYTNWSVYRPGTAKFSPQNINPYLCTHLIYAFGGLTRENSLRPYDKYQDIEQGGYAKFTGLKTYNKQLKTLLAIGGWNEGSTRFSPLVADEERRAELVHNVVRFLRQNHFDGLDLDWEYPAFRDGGKPRDRENYALLVQELRAEFDREAAKTGRPRLLLTMAVPAGIEYIDKGYDIPKLNRYLDFMNILSYDYHSAFEPAVNHHSPLYPLEEDSEYNFDSQLSIDYTVNHYLKLGADRDKLVLGVPTYGRSYTLYNPLATEIGSPADGPGEQGDATREKGYLAYYEICESLQSNDWKVEHPNPNAMGPYAYKGNQWVGYDDINIVQLKSRYVSENGLGGIMFWSIDNDDFRGKCHGRPYPIIEAGKEALLAASSGTSNDVVSVAPSRGSGKTRPKRPPSSSNSNSGTGSGRQSSQSGLRKKRPSTRRQHDKPTRSTTTSTTSTTSTTPAYNYPHTTPEPPTTPDPGSDFKCKDEGFFPHPRDCKKYFWCLDSGPSNLGIVAHQFTCPSGLFFNKGADSCDYARNVVCKKKSGETGSTTTKAPPITAATSRTTRISSSTATTTTTTTTTSTAEPPAEAEDYDEDEYEDEEVEEEEEDPQSIKELINLIKKLGGVEQLEKQLHLQDSEQDSSKSGQVGSGFSRSLYDRVLNRSNNRGNSAFSGGSSTTPRYTSPYRNRPVKPQNEGLDNLDEVKTLRREKPEYVTIKRDKPSTPEPERDEGEEEEEEEEEEAEEGVVFQTDDRNRDESSRPQSNPVEYVTIRRLRPSTPADTATTTPRYITIQRSRKPTPEPEVDDTVKDPDVQDITTEIRPVYPGTTERQPETRIQIVTPVRTLVTEKPSGFRKQSRDEKGESATSEPEFKVSSGGFRPVTPESSIAIYPEYVDVTSIGRRRNNTTTDVGKDTSTPASPLEDPLTYAEVGSTTRKQNVKDNSDFRETVPSSSSPRPFTEPPVVESQPHYVVATTPGRRRGTTLPTIGISKDTVTIKEHTVSDKNTPKYTDISRRRSTTAPSYSDVPTTETYKPKHDNNILRRRSTTVRSTNILTKETELADTDDSVVPTIPPLTAPTATIESTSPGPSVPDTIPTPTTTRFTPTVTRIVTSVTESGTTERQIIAVNRVPYIAIAALRGEKFYSGPLGHNRHNSTTPTTVSFQSRQSFNSSREGATTPGTVPREQKLEKVMEVNRITLVTSKEEVPFAYTRAISGSETTERMLVDTESDKASDRVSEVSQLKHVTVVGGNETTIPLGDYTTDTSGEEFTTLSTILDTPTDRIYHENAIDTHGENPSSIPEYYPTTSTLRLDNISTHSEPVTEPIPPPATDKQTESTATLDKIGSTDTPPRTVTLNNRRRQGAGRKPGVDDFKARRTRPTFSTTSAEPQLSSTPSTFSQRRRGQRKRPHPYRPTLTNAAKEEANVSVVRNHLNVANATANADPNKEPRRTFIPSRGQRKRPRPNSQTSTATTGDEVTNSSEKDRNENSVLANESPSNATAGVIPQREYRRRGKTQKEITETPNKTTEKDVLSATDNLSADVDNSSVVVSTDGNTDGSSDNSKSSTQGSEIFSPETRSKFAPRKGDIHRNFSAESNTNSTQDSSEVETSDNSHSQTTDSVLFTADIAPELDVTVPIPYLNSTGKDTDESVSEEKAIRPSSIHKHVESVTPASVSSSSLGPSIRGTGDSHRVRTKKRRRRPVTHSSVAPPTEAKESPTESSGDGNVTSTDALNVTQNEFKTSDLISERNLSVSNAEENSVTPFATAALFGRDDYEVNTPASVSNFVTTVDREGKHVVEISVLNGPTDTYVPHITQKSKSVSTKNISKVKNAAARNTSNTFEISSHNSELTTTKDSDLNTDGSAYAKEKTGRKSIFPLSTFARTTSEGVHDSFLTTTVESLSEAHSEEITHKKSTKVSTKEQNIHNFIASVDFIADSRDDETLGSTPATSSKKLISEKTEGKSWRLVRRKRPSSTTVEPEAQSEVVTTTTRSLRRPTGALYNPNRVRQRTTTTTTTTTTTETPATSAQSHQQRRQPGARLVRRRKYGSSSNRTRDSDATASDVQPSDSSNIASTDKDNSGGRVRKFSFPRRRSNTTSLPVTTRPVPVTTLPTNDAPEDTKGEIQLLDPKEHQSTDAEVGDELTTTKLPDLANSAVVAIHNLAIVRPTTQPIPEVVKNTRTSAATPTLSPTVSTPATAALFPRRGSAVSVSEEPAPSSPSPRRLPGNLSLRPRPFSKTTPSPAPQTSTLTRTSRPRPPSIIDYEYYDDDDVGILDVAPVSGKVKIHSDGYIECLDRGNFPHPFSCKKFISCAKMENGELLGWEYTCPRQLSFDPIGGICNWSAGLGCKE